MYEYICKQCRHDFESDEEADVCPICGGELEELTEERPPT